MQTDNEVARVPREALVHQVARLEGHRGIELPRRLDERTIDIESERGHAECSLCPIDTYVDTTTSTSVGACIPCFNNSQSFAGSDALDDCRCVGGFERASS